MRESRLTALLRKLDERRRLLALTGVENLSRPFMAARDVEEGTR